MRVVLFAWCASAAPYVSALAAAGAPPLVVVTGPGGPSPDPIEAACIAAGVALRRCDAPNAPGFVDGLARLAPDRLFVAGCPHVLREPLRRLFRAGVVNLHPSLLPKLRGREPLFWSILRGDPHTGVTAHEMTDAVDAGPILAQRAVAIPPRATSASLARLVDEAGAALVPALLAPRLEGTPQDDAAATHVPALRREHGLVDWSRSAEEVDRLVRACLGAVRPYTFFASVELVPLDVTPVDATSGSPTAPGTIVAAEPATRIACGAGAVDVSRWSLLGRAVTARELADRTGLALGARVSANPALCSGASPRGPAAASR